MITKSLSFGSPGVAECNMVRAPSHTDKDPTHLPIVILYDFLAGRQRHAFFLDIALFSLATIFLFVILLKLV